MPWRMGKKKSRSDTIQYVANVCFMSFFSLSLSFNIFSCSRCHGAANQQFCVQGTWFVEICSVSKSFLLFFFVFIVAVSNSVVIVNDDDDEKKRIGGTGRKDDTGKIKLEQKKNKTPKNDFIGIQIHRFFFIVDCIIFGLA